MRHLLIVCAVLTVAGSGITSTARAQTAAPHVTGISPSAAVPKGTHVDIYGQNFRAQGYNTLTLHKVNSSAYITVDLYFTTATSTRWYMPQYCGANMSHCSGIDPNNLAGQYTLTVRNTATNLESEATDFTITEPTPQQPLPVITDFSPVSGPVDTLVTVHGFGFLDANTIELPGGDIRAAATNNGMVLTFTIPQHSGCSLGYPCHIYVTNQNGTSRSADFMVTDTAGHVPLFLADVFPRTAPVGTSIAISGTGFTPNDNTVHFSGSSVMVTGLASSDSGTHLLFTLPQLGAATYSVTVVNANGTSNGLTFTVPSPALTPRITSFFPSSAVPVLTLLNIYGSNFAYQGDNLLTLQRVDSAGYITIRYYTGSVSSTQWLVPSYCGENLSQCVGVSSWPGRYTMTIKNLATNLVSQPVDFTITTPTAEHPLPVIESFSPPQGPVGTVVTINGSGFLDTNTIDLQGAVVEAPSSNGGHAITFTMPSGSGCAVGYPCHVFVTNLNGSVGAISTTPRFILTDASQVPPTPSPEPSPAASPESSPAPSQCSFVIAPPSGSMETGTTIRFTAFFDPDGPNGPSPDRDVTLSTQWTSSRSSVAVSQGNGVVMGRRVGNVIITAMNAPLCPGARATADVAVTRRQNRPPVLQSCQLHPLEGAVPLVVSYSAHASDPDNDALTYLWNFGFGQTKKRANGMFTYHNAGSYTVTLQVRDAKGNMSQERTCGVMHATEQPKPTSQHTPSPTPAASPSHQPIETPTPSVSPHQTPTPTPTPSATPKPTVSPSAIVPESSAGPTVKTAYIGAPNALTFSCPQNATTLKALFGLENVGPQAALFGAQSNAPWLTVYVEDPDTSEALIRDGVSVTVTVRVDCTDARNRVAASGTITLTARDITTGSVLDTRTMTVNVVQRTEASLLQRVSRLLHQTASIIFSLLGL